ncbi:hypothetical protein GLOIN_2v1763715 [Rhizophagus irregularis DAOM 181602=DAOM 197198]|uniref:Uncharacterized protein n=1 Tax=Rhizophagus irregularis (strain DAOM 181602 / DAOM 197198 / MUCL 43194) TaxID=747089 RepID=A0A2P4QTZ8_RHIID|nr:hypothetical protein GLOIN_2v1763715 [Rhizophagus irregularis DAOM 181602=DAOM 197198]POG81092.1 hypothetical protein GLOIN_2v1763715 [Rhizophagus irregularis DAOM 181602=DAOM 197198]|eukprot:XP_025187958.1 hypothetical protein GLOIN_2v1763715 [Rhizophagus irregularis DAOM 181602=DAOM 197198]
MDKNVAKRFDGIDKKIDDKINDVYKNMRGEFGKIYEIIARNEIGKKYRQHYSEEFNVYDLNGLNNGLIENFKDYVNKAEKLYNSDNHIELFSFAKESINIALKKKDKSHQIYLDQKWDGVFLKANMINIDVRGKIEVIVTGINVILNLEIGEIKRSESNDIIKHGFVQLCWRLAVIGYALDILFPNIKCTLIRALIILLDTFLYKNERRVETKKWTKAFE